MTDAERLIELRKLLDGQGCVESMGCNAAQFCVCDAMQDALDIADSQVTLIQQQAARIVELEGALERLRVAATLLLNNAEGCAVNHYGEDFSEHAMPGWLADCACDIQAARAVLGEKL